MKKQFYRYFRTACLSLAILLSVEGILLMVLIVGDHAGLFSSASFFYGADYLPTHWLAIIIIPAGVLFLLSLKWRYALSILAIYALFFISFGDVSFACLSSSQQGHTANEKQFSVVALNVQYYSHGVHAVTDSLKSMNQDIILLSENALTDSQLTIIRQKLPMMHLFSGHKNSTAILSRYPILEQREVELPSHEASLSGSNDIQQIDTAAHRSFVHTVVDVDGKKVNVISIRFIAGRPKKNTLRENLVWGRYLLYTQLQEVDFFMDYLKKLQGPIIFGGDLNAPPTSKVIKVLNAVASDAYLEHHFWGTLTFRTEFPIMRLDYMFSMNGAKSIRSDRPSIIVSDHFPVTATFSVSSDQ